MNRAWLLLFVAGLFEAGWAVGLEYSDGFTNLRATLWVVVTMLVSVYLLAQAVRTLPVGTAYAVWTGIGALITVAYGIVVFDEPAGLTRLFFIGLILAGIVGLQTAA
jgi:quaternary ammonium compound-resistance protein SugE